jgi:hypothetical protein
MLCAIRCLLLVLLTAACAGAQSSSAAPQHIISGANVFIEQMNGFEDYLAAAMHAKHVPLVVVTEKDKADFTISGSASADYRDQHRQRATIKVVNKSGTVVFAYAFDQDYALHGKQTAAEACAKNLKKEIVGR